MRTRKLIFAPAWHCMLNHLLFPIAGQYMERCNVCNEKNYLSVCAHCEKKICEDCKAAHTDILKREISRINNQVSLVSSSRYHR